jgi:hypothetical protein
MKNKEGKNEKNKRPPASRKAKTSLSHLEKGKKKSIHAP